MAAVRPPISKEESMTISRERAILAGALSLSALFLAAAAPALAHDHAAIRISDAWCPPTPPGAPTAAGYLTITNSGRTPDRLIGETSPVAVTVQLHSMTMQGQIMRMRAAAEGLPVAGGQVRAVQPGGEMHLMLIGLKRPLRAGEHVPLALTFAHAGRIDADFVVRPRGDMAPAVHRAPHDHMDHMTHMGAR